MEENFVENTYTKEDLKVMQSWPLERKIQVTQTRIIEWKNFYNGNVYVSFSGGKDSTVLVDLVARVYQMDGKGDTLNLVFVNTGLEYPEIQEFVSEFKKWIEDTYCVPVELTILYPEKSFFQVITDYGYPVIGKDVATRLYYAKRGSRWAINQLNGFDCSGQKESKFANRFIRYNYLINAPFHVSHICCNIMKKRPFKHYSKTSGKKPMIATMAEESSLRLNGWLRQGCNAFNSKIPKSTPMSFWTQQNVLHYLRMTKIPYCSVYGDIIPKDNQTDILMDEKNIDLKTSNCSRTGCMYCMFGIMSDKEPNRFQRMKETHPRQYEYCLYGGHFDENGILQPDKNGLGIKHILDYLGKPY